MSLKPSFTKFYSKRHGDLVGMPCIICPYHKCFLQLHLLTGVQTLYLILNEFCLFFFLLSCFVLYVFLYIYCILYIYTNYIYIYTNYIYIYIYVCTYIRLYITFIHSLYDFALVALIRYIKILNKQQVELLQTNMIKSVRVSKKNPFSKTSRTRNNIFFAHVVGFCGESQILSTKHPSFLSLDCLYVMLSNNFCFAGSKNCYVCFDANINFKLIFWRW